MQDRLTQTQVPAEAPPAEDQAPQPTAAEVPAAAPAVEATPEAEAPKRRESIVDKLEDKVDKILHRRSSSVERKTKTPEEGAAKKEKFHWPHLGKGPAKEEKKPEPEAPAAETVVPAA